MHNQRWEIKDAGGGVIAHLHGTVFNKRQAERAAQWISDTMGIQVTHPALRTGPFRNPTLVHHGSIRMASFHVFRDPGGDAIPQSLADLYSMHPKVARQVAQALANGLKTRVMLLDNRDRPARLAEHPMEELGPMGGGRRRLRNPKRKGRKTAKSSGAWGVSGVGVTGAKVWLSKSGYWTATRTTAGRWTKGDADNRARQAYEVGTVERGIRIEALPGKAAAPPARRATPRSRGPRRNPNPGGREWRKVPSVTPGGKPFFWFSNTGGRRLWVVWDRHAASWSLKDDHSILGSYRTAGEGKKAAASMVPFTNPKGRKWQTGDRFMLRIPARLERHEYPKGATGFLTLVDGERAFAQFDDTPYIHPQAVALAWLSSPITKNPPPLTRRVRRSVASGRFAKARYHQAATVARGVRRLELQRRAVLSRRQNPARRVGAGVVERLRAELDDADAQRWAADGYTHHRDPVTAKERRDFWALDIGTSGAFMVRKSDGAVFGIKGYGTPDYRKGIGFADDLTGYELIKWRHARGPFRVDMKAPTANPRGRKKPGLGEAVIYTGPAWWYEREGPNGQLLGAEQKRYNEVGTIVKLGKTRALVRSLSDGRLAWADLDRLERPEANPRGRKGGFSAIVKRAIVHSVTNIGQLTPAEKRELEAAVRAGYLEKGKGGPFPAIKTVYAVRGYPFAEARRHAIDEMMALPNARRIRHPRRLPGRAGPQSRSGRARQAGSPARRYRVRGKVRANPRDPEVERGRRTFRRLNEIEPEQLTRVRAARGAPRVGVHLGDLVSFVYESAKYDGTPQLYEHRTRRPRPVLATDPAGREVHIVGGRMHPTPDGLVN